MRAGKRLMIVEDLEGLRMEGKTSKYELWISVDRETSAMLAETPRLSSGARIEQFLPHVIVLFPGSLYKPGDL